MLMIMNAHDHDEPRIVIRVSTLVTATSRWWQRNGIHPPALRLCFGLEVVFAPAPARTSNVNYRFFFRREYGTTLVFELK